MKYRNRNIAVMAACFAVCAATTVLSAQTTGSAKSHKRPNIIVILADDLGWSDTGAFGSEIKTPNIDKLAEEGKKFSHFYNTARCCPSRASLLTGLYPHEAGVGHMLWPTGYPGYTEELSTDSVTMAEVLRQAGYETYMTGKWHVATRHPDPANPVDFPLKRGFDKFYGTILGYGSYFDPASLCRGNTYITPENDPEYKPENFYYTDAISDNAVMYMKEHEQEKTDKPFFMYVAYTAAHWPLMVPQDTLDEYKGKYDAGYDAIRSKRVERLHKLGLIPDVGTTAPTVGDWDAVKDKKWEASRMEAFAAVITRMDQGVGKIVNHLKQAGELDNTLVIYLQDNGGCDETFFMKKDVKPENPHKMGKDELQTRTLPPMQTRDGRQVHTGPGVIAGPADSFIGYGREWANVSDTPLRKYKHYTYEGGIATPLIVHWPAAMGNPHGEIVTEPGHLIDIMPTLVEVAEAKYPKEFNGRKIQPMEGVSLIPLLTDKGKFHRDEPIFWEHEENRAVRQGKWKLVADGEQPWDLYDMTIDRAEMHNVAAEHPEVVKKMDAQWNAYADRAKVRPLGAHRLRKRVPDPKNTPDHLELVTGDVYPRENAPAISNAGIKITAHIDEMAPNGVIVAQGAGAAGYSLYMQDGKAHFAVRRSHELLTVESDPIKAEGGPAVINVQFTKMGVATIQVDDKPSVTKNFYGPFLETPNDGLEVGWDMGGPVGKYPKKFPFQGKIKSVELDVLHK